MLVCDVVCYVVVVYWYVDFILGFLSVVVGVVFESLFVFEFYDEGGLFGLWFDVV